MCSFIAPKCRLSPDRNDVVINNDVFVFTSENANTNRSLSSVAQGIPMVCLLGLSALAVSRLTLICKSKLI